MNHTHKTAAEEDLTTRRKQMKTVALAAAGTVPLLHADDSGIVPTMVRAAAAKIAMQPLRRNIYVIEGSGGNIAVLTGSDGQVLVDAGFAVSREGISKVLSSVSRNPLRHLINTHGHTDHTDGNEWLNQAGATIIAHENTRKRLSVETRVEGWNWTFPAAPRAALPTTVFGAEHWVTFNNTRIHLKYYKPAHTDSDISVNFTQAEITHLGDTWWNGLYPFIDYSKGGSIDGAIRAAEVNVANATSKHLLIPGHGAVGGKADIIEFRDMLVAIRQSVGVLKKRGMTLSEAIAAKPTGKFDAKWGQSLIAPAAFTGLVYAGVQTNTYRIKEALHDVHIHGVLRVVPGWSRIPLLRYPNAVLPRAFLVVDKAGTPPFNS